MTRVILLDTGPLGMIVNPRKFPEIKQWLQQRVTAGEDVQIPELADYELRRGLLRLSDATGIQRLDQLAADLGYLPISTAAMRQAAQLWADARRRGAANAPDLALDGDVILAAQAATLAGGAVIATENPGHLSRYTTALHWKVIT
jgi:predicted nucleic acid-binding protein